MFSRLSAAVMTSFLIASLCLSASAWAQVESLSPQQLHEDLQIAKRSLEEAHGGMYCYRSKAYVDQQFAEAQAALNQSSDALSFYRLLKPAVASIKESLKHELLLPFEVKILQGHAFIFRDLSDVHQFAGREILSINGIDIKSIVSTMTIAMHGDGNIPTMRAIEVGRAFKELLFTLLQMRGEFKVVLRDPKSKRKVEDTHF